MSLVCGSKASSRRTSGTTSTIVRSGTPAMVSRKRRTSRGIQMRFKLAGILGQRVEAGDENLLFGQRWQWNLNLCHHFYAQGPVSPRPT